jgi:hypothetical protein
MNRLIAIACLMIIGAGCTPYNSRYMCEASRDYGKCSDVKGAYDAALASAPAPERVSDRNTAKDKDKHKDKKNRLSPTAVNVAQAQDMYRTREYQQLAALIEQPTVPLVKMPTALRTLVISYSSGKTLYMPRYIYFFDDDANFVFGDYLTPRDGGGPMIVPSAGPGGVTTTKSSAPTKNAPPAQTAKAK